MYDHIIFYFLIIFLVAYLISLYFRFKKKTQMHLKRLEDDKMQIIQLEKMASLGTLSAGIAHEINNPLTFVITNLDLISSYTRKIKEVKDVDDTNKKLEDITISVQECLDGANRIKRIVQDLLAFSHSSQGKVNNININDLLDTTVRILWNEIKYKSELSRDYKAATNIWIDSNQISQVFLNLILNASHAIKKLTSSEKGNIFISTIEDEKYVIIKIADTGCGIPKKDMPKIFNAFYTTSGGTGLGLYVSRRIVENHGGTITAANGEKSGAVFTVKLPKVRPNIAKE